MIPKKKKRRTGLSPKYLDDLWSKAIKKRDGYKCVLCPSGSVLESHHVVHRRQNWVLRWNIKNGITLCKMCHDLADTLQFKNLIAMHVDMEYLADIEMRYPQKADFLIDRGMSEAEARKDFADKLKKVINSRLKSATPFKLPTRGKVDRKGNLYLHYYFEKEI